jgi:hypothetical protein
MSDRGAEQAMERARDRLISMMGNDNGARMAVESFLANCERCDLAVVPRSSLPPEPQAAVRELLTYLCTTGECDESVMFSAPMPAYVLEAAQEEVDRGSQTNPEPKVKNGPVGTPETTQVPFQETSTELHSSLPRRGLQTNRERLRSIARIECDTCRAKAWRSQTNREPEEPLYRLERDGTLTRVECERCSPGETLTAEGAEALLECVRSDTRVPPVRHQEALTAACSALRRIAERDQEGTSK